MSSFIFDRISYVPPILKNAPKKNRIIKDESGNKVTLSVYNLSGRDLVEANLSRADLRGAYLRGAVLAYSDLEEADLTWADLTGADLTHANLSYNVKLKGANLSGADLRGADLGTDSMGADLTGANLSGADLSDANLTGMDLRGVNLSEAKLPEADLTGALLSDADLSEAKLMGAKLMGANLSEANLSEADLRGADFTGANLSGADFTGADYTGAYFTEAILTGAIGIIIPDQVVAYEIHNKSDILTSNSKFIDTIEANKDPKLESFNYDEIQNKFVKFINTNENFKESDKLKLIRDLTTVINKAKQCEIPQGDNANIINKAINFAFNQDSRFTEAYISIFIDETSKAYTGTYQTSCVKGIKERFYTSLLGAALQVETIEGFIKTSQIKTLYCIASTGNIQKDPNKLIQMWSKSWEGRDDEWKNKSEENRKKDFKEFMLKEYIYDGCYAENQEAIVKTIETKVTEFDYVFRNNDAAADFYGGNKHNNKIRNIKSKKIRNPAKNKKNKTKKRHRTKKVKQTGKRRTKRK